MMHNRRILLAEDEIPLAEIIADSLASEQLFTDTVHNGHDALHKLTSTAYDIAVIDVMLPGLDGFSIVKQFRKTNQHTPVLFLTSKTMPHDVVRGFESGGNDYLKKPFSMEELVIRIKVLLTSNRLLNTAQPNSAVFIGKYTFNPIKQRLTIEQECIALTARENDVLWMLYRHRQTHVEKQQLLNTIWGSDNFFHARTLDVFITRLRKYLRNDPEVQIINLRGVGYKLVW